MVSTRLGLKATVGWRICATHRLPTAWERDLASSDHEAPEQLKPRLVLEQLSRQIIDDVPQPADNNQSGSSSVERPVRASHSATGWACKAPSHDDDLVRRRSALEAVHREIVGAVQGRFINLCAKGLTKLYVR